MAKKKDDVKRFIEIEGIDKRLELSKAAKINGGEDQPGMIHLDQLKDGSWRLIWSGHIIPDMTQVSGFKIIRED